MTVVDIDALTQTVQHNCAISDARHARDYSMCVYLLRMREFYRWQNNIPLNDAVDALALGNWVSDTECWWDDIEEQEYRSLSINGRTFDPFDVQPINRELHAHRLAYTAGTGRQGQPHFVLGERRADCQRPVDCIEFDRELARDLITLPAMAQNGTVYIRHDSIRRLLWQMFDEWSLRKQPGPMARLVEHYGLLPDNSFESTITAAATDLSDLLFQHELGELRAGAEIGAGFSEMTQSLLGSRHEIWLRAVRDLYADSLVTLPFIVERQAIHYLDFWLAGTNGAREQLLKKTAVYDDLSSSDNSARLLTLEQSLVGLQQRWQFACTGLLNSWQTQPAAFHAEQLLTERLLND